MSTLTKEWLQQTIAELEEERDAVPGAVNEDALMALAAMNIALASLEAEKMAEPVAKVETVGVCWYADNGVPRKPAVGTELYAAPPAPVVPDAYIRDGRGRMMLNGRQEPRIGYSAGWNACRAAMLQGAEPVSNRDELTDGWVACSERMPSPSTGVIVAAPWQSAPGGYAMKWATNCPGHPDADIDGWIIPGASWSPTHWMPLPAAPQQEV